MLGQPRDSCCCQQCTVTKGQASLVSFYPHTPSARARRDFTRAYIQRQTTAYAEKSPSNCQMQKGHLRFQVSKPQFWTNTLLPPDGTGSKMPSPKLVLELCTQGTFCMTHTGWHQEGTPAKFLSLLLSELLHLRDGPQYAKL